MHRAYFLHAAILALVLTTISGCAGVAQQDSVDTLEQQIDALNEQLSLELTNQQNLLNETQSATQGKIDNVIASIAKLEKSVAHNCKTSLPIVAECESQTVIMHDDRMVVGQEEKVRVDPPGFVMIAKIDTGAQSSSIHAEDITEFERDGNDWVRFHIINEKLDLTIERPVEKYVRVYQQSDKEGTRRAVVKMRILIGSVQEMFEFTLADRSHLEHDMILGKNFLTDIAVVDVGREFVQPLPKAK
jgi:hypothetical protein